MHIVQCNVTGRIRDKEVREEVRMNRNGSHLRTDDCYRKNKKEDNSKIIMHMLTGVSEIVH